MKERVNRTTLRCSICFQLCRLLKTCIGQARRNQKIMESQQLINKCRPPWTAEWEIISTEIFQRQSTRGVLQKGVLRNFAKFRGKHLCQGLFFDIVAGLRTTTLFKKRLRHRCFDVNFAKFVRAPFLTEHLQWMFLII